MASAVLFDSTEPETVRKSSPAPAPSEPPAPSMAAEISSAERAPAPFVRSCAAMPASPSLPAGV
jgi:hypothetical protein